MSSRERQATDSDGRHPRMDPNLSSDDSQNPDAIDAEPIKEVLQENRERFSRIMTSTFRAMEVKVKDVLKTQCEQRQKLYQDYSLQVTNLNRRLTSDAIQVKKQAEKLSNMFMELQKFIHESLTLQKNRMEEFKSLCEEYLEKFEVLRDSQGNFVAEELRCLIATLEKKPSDAA